MSDMNGAGKLQNVRDLDPKTANILYHDMAAQGYEEKWSIQYDETVLDYVEARLLQVLPEKHCFPQALEIGAGTGFFLLNLYNGGWVEKGTAVDISPRSLEVCAKNAEKLGWSLTTEACDAECLPFPDNSFDLVCGHAFLHHMPKPGVCVNEMARVCKPGGTVLIAGEPSVTGHRIAQTAKKLTYYGVRLARWTPARRLLPAKEKGDAAAREMAALESVVDLWEFDPTRLAGMFEGAGLVNERYVVEELASSVVGWGRRTVEGMVPSGTFGKRWAYSGFRSYQRLAKLDAKVLSKILPQRWFYNITIAAEKPL